MSESTTVSKRVRLVIKTWSPIFNRTFPEGPDDYRPRRIRALVIFRRHPIL